jgi:hypothetical protein
VSLPLVSEHLQLFIAWVKSTDPFLEVIDASTDHEPQLP